MKAMHSARIVMCHIAATLFSFPMLAQQPAGDALKAEADVPQPSETSAAQWRPTGIRSPRNAITFRPSPDGSLRSGKNANLGDDGNTAAKDQTAILRSEGMPKHLQVHYDPQTNGFYIAAKPDATKSTPVPSAPPAPVETPAVANLVISEFFVPAAKLADAAKRTITLPSGAVTSVPLELWQPGKLLNTTEGPVQLPLSLESAAQPNLLSPDPTPELSPLPTRGWKGGNSVSRVGSVMTIVRDGRVMTHSKLKGGPENWSEWCKLASPVDRDAGVIPPGYKWVPTKEGRAIAVPMKEDAP